METALPLLLFLGFLFGSTLLILVCGMQSQEEARAREIGSEPEPNPVDVPHFLARPGGKSRAIPAAIDPALIGRMERYLLEEQLLAQEFVERPSVEALHRHEQWRLVPPVEPERVEEYLRHEQQAAREFVIDPSIERLHGPRPLVAALV